MIALILTAAVSLTDPATYPSRSSIECPDVADLGSPIRYRLALDLARPLRETESAETLGAIAALFVDHGFDRAESVNYLVAAYCPIFASDRSLNAYEQTLRVQDFAEKADAAIVAALQSLQVRP